MKKLCSARRGRLLSAFIASFLLACPYYGIVTPEKAFAAETVMLGTEDGREPLSTRIQRILDSYDSSSQDTGSGTKNSQGSAVQEEGSVGGPAEKIVEPPPPEMPPAATERTMSFDWRNAPVAQSIYAVARAMNMGVVINAKVDGMVYANLKNVTCQQALDYLGRVYNFNWMIEDGTIWVTTNDLMKQTVVLPVDYANKQKVVEEFKALGIEDSRIYANSENGTVSVTGTPWQLRQARRTLKEVDQPTQQCLILAQLVEVTNGRDLSHGVSWSLPTFTKNEGDSWGSFGEKITLSAAITANKSLAKGKVIARPLVSMFNGETGTVSFGDSVPIMSSTTTSSATTVSVEYKDVGTKLVVTPSINKRLEEVSLSVNVEVSNIVSWTTSNGTRAPQIATRNAKTTARVRSGESFVIGGLMSKRELDNLVGIPGLMDLPILGALFRAHEKSTSYSEVYVILTPFIVEEGVNPKALLSTIKRQDESAQVMQGK